MTKMILDIFKFLLYLQLLGCIVAGYIAGAGFGAAFLNPLLEASGIARVNGYTAAHYGGAIGGTTGFLVGTLLTGYGLVLLSMNHHLARIATNIGYSTAGSLPRIEPQVRR